MNKLSNKRNKRNKKVLDILIWGIKETSFNFTNKENFNEDVVGNVKIEGIFYNESKAIYFNLNYIIEIDGKPVIAMFKIFINKLDMVVCEPDIYNNSIYGIKAESLHFNLKNTKENMKNGNVEDDLYNI